jgi:hypothetical protein
MDTIRSEPGGSMSAAAPWWKRLAWMMAIWAASVAALGLVSLALRFWLKAR